MNTSAPPAVQPQHHCPGTEGSLASGLHRDHHGPPVTGHGERATCWSHLFQGQHGAQDGQQLLPAELACADLIMIPSPQTSIPRICCSWATGLWAAGPRPLAGPGLCGQQRLGHEPAAHQLRPLLLSDPAPELPPSAHPAGAALMIGLAWLVSFVLWAPAILFWQYLVGERTVLAGQCYIQFLSQPIITFACGHGCLLPPVTVMCTLYWRIYRETEGRAGSWRPCRARRRQGRGRQQQQLRAVPAGARRLPETPPGAAAAAAGPPGCSRPTAGRRKRRRMKAPWSPSPPRR